MYSRSPNYSRIWFVEVNFKEFYLVPQIIFPIEKDMWWSTEIKSRAKIPVLTTHDNQVDGGYGLPLQSYHLEEVYNAMRHQYPYILQTGNIWVINKEKVFK